jgi:chorismate mutase
MTKFTDINQVRIEIDRVDKALLKLIAERLELSKAVRRAKSGMRVWRPSREDSHVRELAAATHDTPRQLVSRIWAELMSASLAMQGPMGLHVALEGDAMVALALVRDRFGASIPTYTYPTASSALAATYADPEGVAVLPSPGGMHNWWTALGPNGAMPDMHILAGLPRTGTSDWPSAVAVATADIQPSGNDDTLILSKADLRAINSNAKKRATSGELQLYSLPGYLETIPKDVLSLDPSAHIIGALPRPIG